MKMIQLIEKDKDGIRILSSRAVGARNFDDAVINLKAKEYEQTVVNLDARKHKYSYWIEVQGVSVNEKEIKYYFTHERDVPKHLRAALKSKTQRAREILRRCALEAKTKRKRSRPYTPPQVADIPDQTPTTSQEKTMSLKVKAQAAPARTIEFPCLMTLTPQARGNGVAPEQAPVFLMNNPEEGTALRGNGVDIEVGEHFSDLIFDDLEMFMGGLTLEQD